MYPSRLQVLVWALVPVLGLLLLVAVLAARGGTFFIIPFILLLGIALFVLLSARTPRARR
jgi:hypothetical protein